MSGGFFVSSYGKKRHLAIIDNNMKLLYNAVIMISVDKSFKDKIVYSATVVSVLLCALLSGGISWQGCLCSLIFMTVCIFVAGGIKNVRYLLPLAVIVITGVISVFGGLGNTQTGIYEFVKFMCFVAAFALGQSFKDKRQILKVIYYTAFAVAFIGILAYCRIIDFSEFTFRDAAFRRLQSSVRYANVTACVLACGYISFLELFCRENKRVYLYGGACIIIALYLTISKACLPVFLVLGTAYLCKNKQLSRIFLVQNLVAIFIVSVLIIADKIAYLPIPIIAAGLFVSARVGESDTKYFKLWICVSGFFVLAAAAAIVYKPSLFQTFAQRIGYMKDSIALISENFLFGCGFGSWRVLQYKVQTWQYSVTYLHNGILQMLIENGFLFTTAFLVIIVLSVIKAVKSKSYFYAAMIMIIALHSLVDCDLSFGVVLIILGLISGNALSGHDSTDTHAGLYRVAINLVLVLCLSVTGVYALSEYILRCSFENAYLENEIQNASKALSRLEVICHLDANVKVNRAMIEAKTSNDKAKVTGYLKEATRLSPYDAQIYEDYMSYCIADADISKLCSKYVELAPKQERTYAFLRQYLQDAKEKGIISQKVYSGLLAQFENRRIKEEVIDRDDLLTEISQQ